MAIVPLKGAIKISTKLGRSGADGNDKSSGNPKGDSDKASKQ